MARAKDFFTERSIKESKIDHPDHTIEMEPYKERDNLDGLRGKTPSVSLNKSLASRYAGMGAPGGAKLNPSFLPTYISGLVVWRSPVLSSASFSSDGQMLVEPDLSGNGNNFIALTTRAPLFTLGAIGGVAAAKMFTNKATRSAFTTVPQPLTIFLVTYTPGNPINDYYLDSFDTSICSLNVGSNGTPGYPQRVNIAAGVGGAADIDLVVGPHIICAVFNGANSFLRIDGIQSSNLNAGNNSLVNGLSIGTAFNQASAAGGYIGDVGVYNKQLSTLELQQLERRYLNTIYNTMR